MSFSKKWVIIIGVVLSVLISGSGLWGVTQYYQERLFPGTIIGGVDVSLKTKAEAEKMLNEKWKSFKNITLEWNGYKLQLPLLDMQVIYKPEVAIKQAEIDTKNSDLGKKVFRLINLSREPMVVEPVFEIEQTKLLENIASVVTQINIPAQNPEIRFDRNTKTIEVVAGENGQEVDVDLLKQRIYAAIRGFSTTSINIPVRQLQPRLSDQQLEKAKGRAGKLIDKSLVLKLTTENQEWKIETEQLLQWLDPATLGWKQIELDQWIVELAHTIDRPAQNASFRFVPGGKVEEFRPEKDGYVVKQPALTQSIQLALSTMENRPESILQVEVPIERTRPEVTNGEVNDLGIKTLIGRGESWFSGSITNRIFNLKKAADALNGVLVAPGEEFSFNKTVGDISQATGYKSAFIIREGKTILGDGGGVCQTSSTLFRAILNAGLPIDERIAHAYRVSYYEQNYQPGFDATIFQPSPDFKFKNDTPGYVLIQTVFDEEKKHLVFEIYGTNDGRVATVTKARIWDVVSPPPDLYIDDPNLSVGKVVQTEHAARGSKVAFDWKVTRGDEVLQERTFYSNYKAWQGVYLRGTKVN